MTTICKNGAQENFIHLHMRGGPGEYIMYLQAVTAALACAQLTKEQREALTQLLTEMLPEEQQIKTDEA